MICYLDIDGVVRDLGGFYESLNPGYPAITSYYTPAFNKVWLEHVSDPEKAAKMYVGAPICAGAKEAYDRLRSVFGTVTYLSANGKKEFPWLTELSLKFLKKHKILSGDDTVNFVSGSDDKIKVMRKDPGILFDDKVSTIMSLPDSCCGVWVMNNMTGDIAKFLRSHRGRNTYVIQNMSGCDDDLLKWMVDNKVVDPGHLNLEEEKKNG